MIVARRFNLLKQWIAGRRHGVGFAELSRHLFAPLSRSKAQKFIEGIEALRVFMKSKGDVKLPEEHLLHSINVNDENGGDSRPNATIKNGPVGNVFFDRKGGKTLGARNKRPFQ